VFTTDITPKTSLGTTFILVSIIVVMCAIFWYFFMQALNTQIIRQFFSRSQSILQRVCGIIFIGLGLRVALLWE
jgi:threonine/homoserine/homoserine lactone efflux protein